MATSGSQLSPQEQCVKLYEAILEDIRAGRLLSHVGLTLLQHHVYNEMRDKRAPVVKEDNISQVCVEKLLQIRLDAINRQRFTVLVSGEYNAGKSTFLNILMGGDYLPMNRGRITKVVCEIRNDVVRKATLCFLDNSAEKTLDLSNNTNTANWNTLRECIRNPVYEGKTLSRIIIQWLFPDLQDINALTVPTTRPTGTTRPSGITPASSTQPIAVPTSSIDTDTQTDTDSDLSVSRDGTRMTVDYPPLTLVNQTSSPNTQVVRSTDSSYIHITGNNRISPGHIHVNKGNHDNRSARGSVGVTDDKSSTQLNEHTPPDSGVDNTILTESTDSSIDSDGNNLATPSRPDKHISLNKEQGSTDDASESNDTQCDYVDKEADKKSNNSGNKETGTDAESGDTEATGTTQESSNNDTASFTEQGVNSVGQVTSTQQPPHNTSIDIQTGTGLQPNPTDKIIKRLQTSRSLDTLLYERRRWHPSFNQETNTGPKLPRYYMQAPVSDSSTSSSDLSDSNRSAGYINAGIAGMEGLRIPVPITFVDCPGVDENNMTTSIETVVAELDNSDAFIFLVDTIAADLGVRKHGILQIVKSISTKLACSARHFNADAALFLANKIDDFDANLAEAEVLERLNKLLPMVNREHIGSITANKVLRRLLKHKMRLYVEVADRTVGFLQRAYAAKIEENIVWLIKVTEMAKQISCIPSLPLNPKVRRKLEEDRQKAVKLQDIEPDKRQQEDRLVDKRIQDIHDILCEEKTQIDNIDWNPRWLDEVGAEHIGINPGDRRVWWNVFRRLPVIINEEILKIDVIKEKISKVDETFVEKLNEIYKNEIGSLESLNANFTTRYEIEEKYSVLKQIPTMLAPVALGAAFRLTPIGIGITLMLAPVLPAVWLVSAWKEDYEDYQFQKQLEKFMTDKTVYVREIVNDLLVMDNSTQTSKYLNHAGLLKREDIHKQSLELIDIIDFLLGSGHTSTEDQMQLNLRHYESVCKFYSKHYLDISSRDRADSDQVSNNSGLNTAVDGSLEVQLRLHATDGHHLITVHECMILRQMLMNPDTHRLTGLLYSRYLENGGRDVLDVAFKSGAEGRFNLSWVIQQPRSQRRQHGQHHQQHQPDIATMEQEFVHYARECCECVKALHDKNIAHGRVNPANFILSDCKNDPSHLYGLKMRVKDFPADVEPDAYDAPELRPIKISVTKSSDIFSLGLVFMELWFRQFINKIPKKGNMYQAPENKLVSKLIAACLNVDARRRPNIDSLLDVICDLAFHV